VFVEQKKTKNKKSAKILKGEKALTPPTIKAQ
jgi:hypothetical protein